MNKSGNLMLIRSKGESIIFKNGSDIIFEIIVESISLNNVIINKRYNGHNCKSEYSVGFTFLPLPDIFVKVNKIKVRSSKNTSGTSLSKTVSFMINAPTDIEILKSEDYGRN
jgi:hypothetical protein